MAACNPAADSGAADGFARSPPGTPRPRSLTPWGPIMAAYGLYVLLTFLNDLADAGGQLVGAVLFLGLLAVHAAPRLLPVPLTRLTVSLLLAFLIPATAWVAGVTGADIASKDYAVKYYALLFVVFAGASLRLPPLYRAPERRWGIGATVFVLLASLAPGLPADRLEGWFFSNPNNFALVAMSLLFFVDHARDTRRFIVGVHAFVLGLILLSGTSGAFLGYAAGLAAVLLHTRLAKRAAGALGVAVLLGTVALAALRTADPATLQDQPLIGPLWAKVSVVQQNIDDVLTDGDINFWEVGTASGNVENTSALWRLYHWREVLRDYRQSGVRSWLIGRGIGSSRVLLGNLPHNDYLRLLFEVGALGLLANLAVWVILYRRAAPMARGPAVMMAVYAFTENNFDNFLVMSLFVLFLVGADRASEAAS